MTDTNEVKSLPDNELLNRLSTLVQSSRRIEAVLVAHIGEVDSRGLFRREACSSMHRYCTERLQLSDAEAYLRIGAARAARTYPEILPMLEDGRLHLSGIALLASHLTRENHRTLLSRAAGNSKRAIQVLVAEFAPRPDVPSRVRKLPAPRVAEVSAATSGSLTVVEPSPKPIISRPKQPARAAQAPERAERRIPPTARAERPIRPAVVEPLAPARYKVQFTASAQVHAKLKRAQELMHHHNPGGDVAVIFERALSLLVDKLERQSRARVAAPRKTVADTDITASGRNIPAAIKRAATRRDRDRCAFLSAEGQRCRETHGLEFHHIVPFAKGGDHSVGNVSMRCRAHNVYQAELEYGKSAMDAFRRKPGRASDGCAHYRGSAAASGAGNGGELYPPTVSRSFRAQQQDIGYVTATASAGQLP